VILKYTGIAGTTAVGHAWGKGSVTPGERLYTDIADIIWQQSRQDKRDNNEVGHTLTL